MASAPVPVSDAEGGYVFICYAREDAERIAPELQLLHSAGIAVWYDAGIPPGADWSAVLAARIERCAGFVLFVTPNSAESLYCRQELVFALNRGISVLPVFLEEVVLPPSLRLTLGTFQCLHRAQLDDREYEAGLLAAVGGWVGGAAADAESFRVGKPEIRKASIAVLPFANLSSDPEQAFFSEGIAEDILNRLAMHEDLVVKARSSSFALAARSADLSSIARMLDVSHVLEGSVQKAGNLVRVTARLIRTSTETQLWSGQYTREFGDLFILQDDIGREVLRALDLALYPARHRRLSEQGRKAYNAYLLGRYHANRMDVGSAQTAFIQAIEHDPDYADALAALADSYFAFGSTPVYEKLDVIRGYLSRALASDPDHVLACLLEASLRFMVDLQYVSAVRTCAGLWGTVPEQGSNTFESMLRTLGLFQEALEVAERALERDPLSPLAHRNRSMFLRDLGRYDEAESEIDQAERLGLRVTNERAMLAFERGDPDALRYWTDRLTLQLGSDHWICVAHRSGLRHLSGDTDTCRKLWEVSRATSHVKTPVFFRWLLALFAGELEDALDAYALALRRREHLAFTWSQGNVGMRRQFPWYYDSEPRQGMLNGFGLDRRSIDALELGPMLRLH